MELNNTDRTTEIDSLHANSTARGIEAAAFTYGYIASAAPERRAMLLRDVSERYGHYFGTAAKGAEHTLITKERLAQLRNRYSKMVDAMLQLILSDKPEEPAFYERCWELVCNSILPDDEARIFALYWLLIDKNLPYFRIEVERGMSLADEDFQRIAQERRLDILRLRAIVTQRIVHRTQQADLMIEQLDAAPNRAVRAVLMAHLLHFVRQAGGIHIQVA